MWKDQIHHLPHTHLYPNSSLSLLPKPPMPFSSSFPSLFFFYRCFFGWNMQQQPKKKRGCRIGKIHDCVARCCHQSCLKELIFQGYFFLIFFTRLESYVVEDGIWDLGKSKWVIRGVDFFPFKWNENMFYLSLRNKF